MAPLRPPAAQDEGSSAKILQSLACNILLGLVLLAIGIIVTVLTFHNLSSKNRLFLIGPILVSGGVLSLMKAFVNRKKAQRPTWPRQRARHGTRFIRTRRIREYPDGSSSVYLTPEATATEDLSFGDEPPPYEVVTSAESRYPRTCTIRQQVPCVTRDLDGGITNPALDTTEENEGVAQPPPSYEEVVHMQQTTL